MTGDLDTTVAPGRVRAVGPLLAARASRAQMGVVLACWLGNIISIYPIVNGPLGLFLIPISRDFQWPRARVFGVLGILGIAHALTIPIIGRLADYLGPRRMILLGNLGFGLCVAALYVATPNVALFYGLFALIGVFGTLQSTMMFNRVIAVWFDKARGAMLGATAGLGTGVGTAAVPFVALALMNAFGWRGAFLGLGAIVLAGFPALFLLLRESPRNGRGHPQSADNLAGASLAKAARTSSFWMVLIAIGLGAGCLTAVLAHIVPILADRHFPTNKAIVVVSVVGLVGAAWMFAIGWLLDRVRSPRVIAPLYLVAVFGVLVIERGTTLPVLLAGGVMVGLGMGTEFGALSYFISRYFGLWRFGTIAGVMYMAVTVAQGFTPYLMDVDFDHHGSYRLSLHIVEGILVLGAAIVACLPPYTATRPSWRPASSAV